MREVNFTRLGVRLALLVGLIGLWILVEPFLPLGEAAVTRPGSRHLLSESGSATANVTDDGQCVPGVTQGELFPYAYTGNPGVFVAECFGVVYIFIALALVCDEYFVETLELMADKLKLKPDIAGATLLAMGSSSPELFTSLVANLTPGSAVGVGTIIGSGVFNMTVIMGLTMLFAGKVNGELPVVDWRPILRDGCCYIIAIVTLFFCFYTGSEITWYEGLILVLLYASYVCMMLFANHHLMNFLAHIALKTCGWRPPPEVGEDDEEKPAEDAEKPKAEDKDNKGKDPFNSDMELQAADSRRPSHFKFASPIRAATIKQLAINSLLTDYSGDVVDDCFASLETPNNAPPTKAPETSPSPSTELTPMQSAPAEAAAPVAAPAAEPSDNAAASKALAAFKKPTTGFGAVAAAAAKAKTAGDGTADKPSEEKGDQPPAEESGDEKKDESASAIDKAPEASDAELVKAPAATASASAGGDSTAASSSKVMGTQGKVGLARMKQAAKQVIVQQRVVKAFHLTKAAEVKPPWKNIPKMIFYVITWPLSKLFWLTIPDTSKERWKKFYFLTFIICLCYIAVFAHFMVGWAEYIGCFLRIPSAIVGLTLLALGTSTPDALSAVIVAKHGLAGMAISSSLGSSVFDICLGLGLPWFIFSLARGAPSQVDSTGMIVYICIGITALLLFSSLLIFYRFRVTKLIGIILLCFYVLYVIFGTLVAYPVGHPAFDLSKIPKLEAPSF